MNYYEPHVAEAAIWVLKRNGFETIIPEQVCCGLPLISNGLYDDARERACKNNKVLAEYARAGYRIVGTSTSCTHTLKAEYEEMLDMRDDDTKAVSHATWDICEFLLDLHEEGRLDTDFGRLDEDLPYHAPCQLRSHGIGLPALDLFALVPGLRAKDMDHDCCGIAGTYGMKKEKYPIAMKVGEPLFRKVKDSGATMAACDSETCRWQIETATGVRTRHPVEILAQAYRAADMAASLAAASVRPGSGRRYADRSVLRAVGYGLWLTGDHQPGVTAPARRSDVSAGPCPMRSPGARRERLPRVLVIGSGAVGSFLGGMLAAAGHEVVLLDRRVLGRRRRDPPAHRGAGRVRGRARAPGRRTRPMRATPGCILLAVKVFHLDGALETRRPLARRLRC